MRMNETDNRRDNIMAVLAKPVKGVLVVPEDIAKELFGKPTDKEIMDRIIRTSDKFRKNNLKSNAKIRK